MFLLTQAWQQEKLHQKTRDPVQKTECLRGLQWGVKIFYMLCLCNNGEGTLWEGSFPSAK